MLLVRLPPGGGHLPEADRGWWAAEPAADAAREHRADAVFTGLGWRRVLRSREHEDPDDVADAICTALDDPPPSRCGTRTAGRHLLVTCRSPGPSVGCAPRGYRTAMTSMWEPMTPNSSGPADEIAAADPGAGGPAPAEGFGIAGEDPDRSEETDHADPTVEQAPAVEDVDTVFRTPDPAGVRRDPTGNNPPH
jgi:hypothetical protein